MSLFKPSNLSPNFESVTNGKPLTITFQVNSNGLCQEILDELMKVAKVDNAKSLIMSTKGKTLKREDKISLSEIQDGSTVDVYARLKGGIIEN